MSDNGLLPEFSVGNVISETFDVYLKNLVKFILFGIAAYVPFVAIMSVIFGVGIFTSDPSAINTSAADGVIIATIIVSIASLVIVYIVQGAVIFATVEGSVGRQASLGQMISIGLKYLLPLIGVGIMVSLVAGLGYILLIIPGIIIQLGLSVAVPCMIAEQRGVFDSMSRSFDLTKGYKWQILGVFIIIVILYFIVSFILNFVGVMAGSIGAIIVSVITYGVSATFFAVVSAVIYTNLRASKEGVDTSEIAKVFE
ncbi:hypothetical protein [Kordiimonas sp. SCSIO 12610]|uniref:hypothetical protein n=1 Tax=Kordiimonas sp. SCSIO 12610 TaxID=2829597 RepID=UPI00210A7493|nr:hypothetical protein [Kordiimonas sp. SCSIO 12610]UTW56322.1 hypothetical protein KFF44_05310 [Kordiimonas sp. SCSIO 12610]